MPIFQRAIFLLLLSSLASGAQAETVALRDALTAAVENRPAPAAMRLEADAARAGVTEARSGYLPQLTVSETFAATNEPGGSLFIALNQQRLELAPTAEPYNHPPDRTDFETRLTLEQALYNPDLSHGLARAEAGAEAASARAEWSEEQAAFAAFQAYLGVQQASAALVWAESAQAEAAETLRLASEREVAGVGLRAEMLQARVGLSAAERRRLAAENGLELARRRLALAIGRPAGEVGIARPLQSADLDLEADSAGPPRPDVRAAAAAAAAAEAASRQARAAYLPRLGLTAGYAWHDPDFPLGTEADSWQVGVGLSWTLFDGFRRHGAVARTAAQKHAAQLRVEELRNQAALEVDTAWLRADEAEQQWVLARTAVAAAEESHELWRQRYQAELAPLGDLLAAQADLDRARFDEVQAEAGLLLARGEVLLQRGQFLNRMLPAKEDSL